MKSSNIRYAADFFGLLQALHQRSKNETVWKNLRLVIVHSKEVYIPLNINVNGNEVFKYPIIAADFFGLLQALHQRSKNETVWKNLRLVIVHSKEVYIPLNINQSPFNVGLPIELPDLNQIQVEDLVQRHNDT